MTPTTPTTPPSYRRTARRAVRLSVVTALLLATTALGASGVPAAQASATGERVPASASCSPLADLVGSATGLASGAATCVTQDPMAHTTPQGVAGFVSSYVRITD